MLDTRTGQRVIELETADPVMSIDIADDNSLVTAEAGCAQVWDQKSLAPKRKYAAGDYHINSAALR